MEKPPAPAKEKKPGISGKLIFFMVLILMLYTMYAYRSVYVEFIRQVPYLGSVYDYVSFQIINKTLLGLFYASFLGSLFFIAFPIEPLFLFYSTLQYNGFVLLAVATVGGVLAMALNYLVGRLFSEKHLHSHKNGAWKKLTNRFAGPIIFIGNILPLPIDVIALFLGAAKYSFRKFMLLTVLGRAFKFILLLYFQDYIFSVALPWMKGLLPFPL